MTLVPLTRVLLLSYCVLLANWTMSIVQGLNLDPLITISLSVHCNADKHTFSSIDIAAASGSAPALRDAETESFRVEFLPPLILYVTFPPNYPSEAKPNYLLSCKWLTRGKVSCFLFNKNF